MLSSFQLLVEVRHHALPLIGDPAQAVAGDGPSCGACFRHMGWD